MIQEKKEKTVLFALLRCKFQVLDTQVNDVLCVATAVCCYTLPVYTFQRQDRSRPL